MKTSNKTLWISLVLVLVGCNSFNRYEIKEDPIQSFGYRNTWDFSLLGKSEVAAGSKEPVCPPFQMPDLPKQPDLPYNKIAHLNPLDNAAIDDVYSAYIADLRKHNRLVVTIMTKAYSAYMEKCSAYVSQKEIAEKK